jgi:alpha-beta hydrolase superfamily lysophospholipase
VNPLYLGTAARRLFGIHEPAAAVRASKVRAALLCYPLGQEYIYAHRSMRHLASKLTISGFHTLRFDYFGTGDSGGEESDTDECGLQRDVRTAIETLKEIAQAPKVTLIGLRAGANIAAKTAISIPAEVERVILWDPILATQQVLGGAPMLEMGTALDAFADRLLIVVSENREAYGELRQACASRSAQFAAIEFISSPCPWQESATITGALPVPAILRMQQWLQ